MLAVNFDTASHQLAMMGTGLENGLQVEFTATAVQGVNGLLSSFSLSNGYLNSGPRLAGAIPIR